MVLKPKVRKKKVSTPQLKPLQKKPHHSHVRDYLNICSCTCNVWLSWKSRSRGQRFLNFCISHGVQNYSRQILKSQSCSIPKVKSWTRIKKSFNEDRSQEINRSNKISSLQCFGYFQKWRQTFLFVVCPLCVCEKKWDYFCMIYFCYKVSAITKC